MIRYLFLVLLTAGEACQAATSSAEAECLSNAWYQADANAAAPVSDGNQIGANARSPDP
jgi:hypothetical protein